MRTSYIYYIPSMDEMFVSCLPPESRTQPMTMMWMARETLNRYGLSNELKGYLHAADLARDTLARLDEIARGEG
jgi:hypothetical protein